MSKEIIEQTLLNRGLEIANKLQNELLFGKSEFEKNLHGFLTVAELLNRIDDIKWAKHELLGFDTDVPEYRILKCKIMENNDLIYFKNGTVFTDSPVRMALSTLIHSLNDKTLKTLEYRMSPNARTIFENDTERKFSEDAKIIYTKPQIQGLIAGAKVEMISRLNSMIVEITYGKIPKSIFENFQTKVNQLLSKSNPQAISELNIAIESLGHSEDPERISHVAHACKRLIKAIADELFPSETKNYLMKSGEEISVVDEKFFNRLIAFVDLINSKNRKGLLQKIQLLKNLYGEIPESMNKGTHNIISNQSAEMLVIFSYLILGEILLERKINEKIGLE